MRYNSYIPFIEGRLPETDRRWGGMRRPRARLVTSLSGSLGQPSTGTRPGCPSRAGRGADEGRRKPSGSGWPKAPVRARKTGAGAKKSPPVERREARLRRHGGSSFASVSGGFASRSGSFARSRVSRRSAPLIGSDVDAGLTAYPAP